MIASEFHTLKFLADCSYAGPTPRSPPRVIPCELSSWVLRNPKLTVPDALAVPSLLRADRAQCPLVLRMTINQDKGKGPSQFLQPLPAPQPRSPRALGRGSSPRRRSWPRHERRSWQRPVEPFASS